MTTTTTNDFRPNVFLATGAVLRAFCKVWHRYETTGFEKVPRTSCLFVGNHSGIGISDVLCLVGAFSRQFGLGRRIVGMMHTLFVKMPIIGWFARGFGCVEANPIAARAAFARGYDVACFPGGDLDSCRPFTAANEVRFGDRRGYIRLAQAMGVPIVPIATIGSHWSYLILPGSDHVAALARKLGVRSKAFPITVGMLLFALTLLVAPSLWWLALLVAIVPTPVHVRSAILDPIDVRGLSIEDAHERVHCALKCALRAK